MLKFDNKGVVKLDQRVFDSFVIQVQELCSMGGKLRGRELRSRIFARLYLPYPVWNVGTGYAGCELPAESADCILYGERDIGMGGTNRAIRLRVDEGQCFEAGRAKFETGLPETAPRDHGTREGMGGGAIPRGVERTGRWTRGRRTKW